MGSETTVPATEDASAPTVVPLNEPADGVPVVVETERGLTRAAAAVAAGEGPVAIDAERASGYRYGQRAYLVQVRREGAGTWLIDPVGCPDLSPLDEAIGAAEWILHAATQDLACLAEVGLRPRQLFDTELAGASWGCPGWVSPRWSSTTSGSAWPRSTPRSTGRPGRCPSRGCATPRSTSRCSASCAT